MEEIRFKDLKELEQKLANLQTGGFYESNQNQISGAGKISKTELDDVFKDVEVFQDLGGLYVIITYENQKKLFDFLYNKFPQIEKKFGRLYEEANDNDIFMWEEYRYESLYNVVNFINQQLIDYVDLIYKDPKKTAEIREIFN